MKGKQGEINLAQESTKGGGGEIRHRPAASAGGSEVGQEKHGDMKGALTGNPTDKNPLKQATAELHRQHPHAHDDHGPHHGGSEHVRHMPLHGMKPTGG